MWLHTEKPFRLEDRENLMEWEIWQDGDLLSIALSLDRIIQGKSKGLNREDYDKLKAIITELRAISSQPHDWIEQDTNTYRIPELVQGCITLFQHYNTDNRVQSNLPLPADSSDSTTWFTNVALDYLEEFANVLTACLSSAPHSGNVVVAQTFLVAWYTQASRADQGETWARTRANLRR